MTKRIVPTRSQNGCFAAEKDDAWCTQTEMNPDIMSCYVLKDTDFSRMKRKGFCGTEDCPFYKKSRSEVRKV